MTDTRGTCSSCGRVYVLIGDGTVRTHRVNGRHTAECEGSWRPPTEAVE